MIEINLIPDVKREYLKTRALRNAVITMSIFIGMIIVAIAVVLSLVLGVQLAAQSVQDRAIRAESEKLMGVEDIDKMVTIQHQLELIDGKHASKTVNSRLFDVLSAINPGAPNNAVISTVKLDPTGKTISIEGSAAHGYIALEVFKKTITNTFIHVKQDDDDVKVPLASDIVAGDTSFGENSDGQRVLRFSFSFTYPDELFMISESPVLIVTPQGRTDVTDSKLGVPDSLFGAKANDIKGEERVGNE